MWVRPSLLCFCDLTLPLGDSQRTLTHLTQRLPPPPTQKLRFIGVSSSLQPFPMIFFLHKENTYLSERHV